MDKIVKEPAIYGADVIKYIEQLTPGRLQEDVKGLAHDIEQLSNMMGECMKQAMATVVVADITVHVEMKIEDDVLFSSELGHVGEQREEENQNG